MVDCTEDAPVSRDPGLARAISSAMLRLYTAFYSHDRTTATTSVNDKIVVCIQENILSESEDALLADGARGEVIERRVAFQTETEDEFTPGVAAELFFLDAPSDPANVG
jgi:hypothetical protein